MLKECDNCGKEFLTEADMFVYQVRPSGEYYSCGCVEFGISTIREILNICNSTEQCGWTHNTDQLKGIDEALDEILVKCNNALNEEG